MCDPERVLIASVVENREPCITETLCLFRSLRRLGGTLAHARATAYFVGDADPRIIEQLADLNVATKVVSTIEPRCPHANKIHMLDEVDDCDYLVALDNDVVIARDFAAFIRGQSVRARPAGRDPMTLDQWRALFTHCGLQLPSARFLTSYDMAETIPYFNSGVLIVPQEHMSPLSKAWRHFVRVVLDAYDSFPDIAQYAFYTDQVALPLALTAAQVPYCALPLEMNFLPYAEVHPAMEPKHLSPYILHHLHSIQPDGTLKHSSYDNVNATIDAINAAISTPTPSNE